MRLPNSRCFAKSTPPSDTSSHAPLPPARAGPTYPIVWPLLVRMSLRENRR